jgi:hypothetical protein
VHEHIGNPGIAFLDGTFHGVRDAVTFAHGNAAIYSHMQIDVITKAHFADQEFFHLDDTGHSASGFLHNVDNRSAWRCIHNLLKRGFQ